MTAAVGVSYKLIKTLRYSLGYIHGPVTCQEAL